MNLRRLRYFVKIVELGNLTLASEVLHIAQPALSLQLAKLEGEMGKQLLLRTRKGLVLTAAGQILYRHAQSLLRQYEQARTEVWNSGSGLSGRVSIGLTPGTAATTLALPLIKTVRELHPGIVLYLNENLGTTLCEVVGNGLMDLAVLYEGQRADQRLESTPLLEEDLCIVAPRGFLPSDENIQLADLEHVDLLLPRSHNDMRQRIEEAFERERIALRVVAEIESPTTLSNAVGSGVGATILPASAARPMALAIGAVCLPIDSPATTVMLSLCSSARFPLSEPAAAVGRIVLELVDGLTLGTGLHAVGWRQDRASALASQKL